VIVVNRRPASPATDDRFVPLGGVELTYSIERCSFWKAVSASRFQHFGRSHRPAEIRAAIMDAASTPALVCDITLFGETNCGWLLSECRDIVGIELRRTPFENWDR